MNEQAYKEAEKKLERANLEKATTIDLHGMELTRLTESVGQLISLQRLDVSKNLSERTSGISWAARFVART